MYGPGIRPISPRSRAARTSSAPSRATPNARARSAGFQEDRPVSTSNSQLWKGQVTNVRPSSRRTSPGALDSIWLTTPPSHSGAPRWGQRLSIA
ncbi:hypothetical protein AD006_17530 [Pseudonocardia sp. EC080610-09]|nr:hypothetical protein FRP1_09975 [Pseudonocardia sp. EC080625-04]ALL76660.1 hypothetical protein AD006_17530 [Pseudonocardia sp. EC080610-09]ALL83688.1 hypothetical protein AD017_25365 [Pseudonocardia sp. EC080619-01]